MKKLLLTLLALLITTSASAEKRYIYIDKIGEVVKGEEAGHTALGDVVDIVKYTKNNAPTRGELGIYKVLVSDLTDEEVQELLEPMLDSNKEIVQSRKRKIVLTNIKGIQNEETVDVKILKNSIVVKSISSISK
jgi:Glu-tRNA(Gln) amidotransferase subunit E-like FAD-binding protein